MHSRLGGQVVLFTGGMTEVAMAVARRMGREGLRLAFLSQAPVPGSELDALLRQFRPNAVLIQGSSWDPAAMGRALEEAEERLGPVSLMVHTLGPPDDRCEPGGVVLRATSTPLTAALSCSRTAADHMAARRCGHILHLVAESQIGATEVEQLALEDLRRAWQGWTAPGSVALSAIFFQESATLPPPPEGGGERSLLERYGAQLFDEEDRAERFELEERIGALVMEICRRAEVLEAGTIQQFTLAANDAGRLEGAWEAARPE